MKKISFVITACVLCLSLSNCSRKTTPAKEPVVTAPAKKIKTAVPKVIAVNDASAKKTFDGRLYYDLEGHRYWKNYTDGKYYLYNKSMQGNDAYKARP